MPVTGLVVQFSVCGLGAQQHCRVVPCGYICKAVASASGMTSRCPNEWEKCSYSREKLHHFSAKDRRWPFDDKSGDCFAVEHFRKSSTERPVTQPPLSWSFHFAEMLQDAAVAVWVWIPPWGWGTSPALFRMLLLFLAPVQEQSAGWKWAGCSQAGHIFEMKEHMGMDYVTPVILLQPVAVTSCDLPSCPLPALPLGLRMHQALFSQGPVPQGNKHTYCRARTPVS